MSTRKPPPSIRLQPLKQPISHSCVDRILLHREKLVTEINSLRGASHHMDKAQQLLTRWWSTTTWSAREDLLKAADWLIRLEKRGDALVSPPA